MGQAGRRDWSQVFGIPGDVYRVGEDAYVSLGLRDGSPRREDVLLVW